MSEPKIVTDKQGFVYVKGVKVGRCVPNADGTPKLQFWDKDPRRACERGSRTVECTIEELSAGLNHNPLTPSQE